MLFPVEQFNLVMDGSFFSVNADFNFNILFRFNIRDLYYNFSHISNSLKWLKDSIFNLFIVMLTDHFCSCLK